MKHRIFFPAIIALLLLSSCTEDNFVEAEQQLVVEGWIDAGGHPIVMLSLILPVTEEETTFDNIKECVVNWGKVTISDGENSVILTGKRSDDYFPPYIYTTSQIRGEVGKTYYLTAEYKKFRATAKTTIPPKARIEKIVTSNENSKYNISAIIDDNPEQKNYYKFFTKVIGRDNCYLSSNFSIIDDKHHTFPCSVPIETGTSSLYYSESNSYKITEKDRFMIKVAQIDEAMYNFWDDYKNIMELGINPFFRYSSSIRSNISGGLGYWAGYGSTEYLCEPNNHENPKELKK